ncbi:MAG: PilN domain-containing protein [Polyangiales bacterium]
MLKINLLPDEKGRRVATSEGVPSALLLGVVGSLVLLLGGLFLFHAARQDNVDRLTRSNNQVASEIESIKSRVSDHQRILDELAEIRQREEAIEQLQAARTGPTAMLVEISKILSPDGHPTADPVVVERCRQTAQCRERLWSNTWDPQRLWLTSFLEDNRNITITGVGRSTEDVSEFMRRLQLSLYFTDVRLSRTSAGQAPVPGRQSQLAVQEFTITARARY